MKSMSMNIGDYARTLDTVAWFLGKGGWDTVQPMIERKMKENHMVGFGFKLHDGSWINFRMGPTLDQTRS